MSRNRQPEPPTPSGSSPSSDRGTTVEDHEDPWLSGLEALNQTIDSPSSHPLGVTDEEPALNLTGLGPTMTSPMALREPQPGFGDTLERVPRVTPQAYGFLVVTTGARQGDIHRLDKPKNLLGRTRPATIAIDDDYVSTQHASIRCEQVSGSTRPEFVLRDLDSENGTLINGQRVRAETTLKDGDTVRVGETEMVFKRV